MSDRTTGNKRIAKNTLMLYIRMVFVLFVNLYVSRIVLKALGFEDYGLYSVVGSVVSFLGFLNSSMSNAGQRFLSFAQGEGDRSKLANIFNSIYSVQIIIAGIAILVFETIGVFYINHYLNVDPSKVGEANWVFQFSVATFIVNVMTVPYNASIVANERMDIFALYSILEVSMRLGIALLLPIFANKALIYYAALMFVCSIVIRAAYRWSCRRNFKECKTRTHFDKTTVKEILSYASWNLFGTFSGVASDQGVNMILNSFFGVVVNAARGLSFQVSGALAQLYTSFQQAINPQIVKAYAAKDNTKFGLLITQGTRLAFFLLFVCALPIIFNIESILGLWLESVPDYTAVFCVLVIINSMIGTMSQSIMQGALATGEIRKYQIVVSTITLMNLPLSYVALKLYPNPYITMYVMIAISMIAFVARLILVHQMTGLSIRVFLREVMSPIIVSVIATVILALWLDALLPITGSIGRMFLRLLAIFLLAIGMVSILGVKKNERKMVISFIKRHLYK